MLGAEIGNDPKPILRRLDTARVDVMRLSRKQKSTGVRRAASRLQNPWLASRQNPLNTACLHVDIGTLMRSDEITHQFAVVNVRS